MKNFTKYLDKLEEVLKTISKDEIENFFPKDTTPKGWVSIDEHLPKCSAFDFINTGYSTFKVRYKNGKEGYTTVSDHNVWVIKAKEVGITHWFNK